MKKAGQKITETRNETHGSFFDNANYSQNMKRFFHATKAWDKLTVEQQEALDMIALKISRILSGKANFADHWDDIAGYAHLGSKACTTS